MKNLILGFVLVLFLVGCKDDDDNGVSSSELIGTWAWVSTETSMEAGGLSDSTTDEASDNPDWKEYYVFKDNGDVEFHEDYIGENTSVENDFETGSWKLDGNNITLTFGDMTEDYGISIENGNRMILTQSFSYMGIGSKTTEIYSKE
jgi:hypothetical protein